MSLIGLIQTRNPAQAIRLVTVAAAATGVAGILLLAGPASSQGFEPLGNTNGMRVALNRSVTFTREDGSIQSQLLQTPIVPSTDGVTYSLATVTFECVNQKKFIVFEERFSSRRDPIKVMHDRQREDRETPPEVARAQARAACDSSRDVRHVSLSEFVSGSS